MQFVPPLPTLVQRHARALIVVGAGRPPNRYSYWAKVANGPCWRYTWGRVRRAVGVACPTLRRGGGKLSAHLCKPGPILCATRSAIDLTVTACCRGVPVCPSGPRRDGHSSQGLRRAGEPSRDPPLPPGAGGGHRLCYASLLRCWVSRPQGCTGGL